MACGVESVSATAAGNSVTADSSIFVCSSFVSSIASSILGAPLFATTSLASVSETASAVTGDVSEAISAGAADSNSAAEASVAAGTSDSLDWTGIVSADAACIAAAESDADPSAVTVG